MNDLVIPSWRIVAPPGAAIHVIKSAALNGVVVLVAIQVERLMLIEHKGGVSWFGQYFRQEPMLMYSVATQECFSRYYAVLNCCRVKLACQNLVSH